MCSVQKREDRHIHPTSHSPGDPVLDHCAPFRILYTRLGPLRTLWSFFLHPDQDMGYITGDDSMVGVIRIDIDRKGTCLRIASPTQTLYKHGGWPGRRMANDCTSRTLSSGAVRDGVAVVLWRRASTKYI